MEKAPVHVIDDYAAPRLPLPIRVLNRFGAPVTGRVVSLERDDLLAEARRRSGLEDFGAPDFLEPLDVLLRALEEEAALSPLGRILTRQLLLQLLVTRLRSEALMKRHPEILEIPIEAPIFIIGLPRTGTTHLHNLISQDPALRSLPYWESLEPVPDPREQAKPGAVDPRVARCDRAVSFLHWAMPLFPSMHEMSADARHEEIQLLAVSFSTMLFEASYHVPSYRDWYLRTDQTAAYRTLERMLKVLVFLRGGRRWVLKSPQHLEQIGPLAAVFPDARVIQTHRDPVRVTASFCTLGAYGMRMNAGPIDAVKIGHYWADRIERMLNASVRDRHLLRDDQVFDCRFHEFMADDLAMVERIYAFAGQPIDDEVRKRLRHHLEMHRRGRLGRVRYRLEDFALDPGERRRALRHYQERFGVPDEP